MTIHHTSNERFERPTGPAPDQRVNSTAEIYQDLKPNQQFDSSLKIQGNALTFDKAEEGEEHEIDVFLMPKPLEGYTPAKTYDHEHGRLVPRQRNYSYAAEEPDHHYQENEDRGWHHARHHEHHHEHHHGEHGRWRHDDDDRGYDSDTSWTGLRDLLEVAARDLDPATLTRLLNDWW